MEAGMEAIKKMKANYVVEALIMIAIGAVLIFWTEASLLIMARRHGDFANTLLQYPHLVFLTLFSCQIARSTCSFSSSCQINI